MKRLKVVLRLQTTERKEEEKDKLSRELYRAYSLDMSESQSRSRRDLRTARLSQQMLCRDALDPASETNRALAGGRWWKEKAKMRVRSSKPKQVTQPNQTLGR